MAVGDVYRLALVGRMHGHLTVNTFHYVETVAPSIIGDVPLLIKNTFQTTVLDLILTAASVQWTAVRIEVQKIWPLPVAAHVEYVLSAPGTVAGTSVPDTVALVIQRRGPLAGRRNRGRIYLAGMPITAYEETTGTWDILAYPGFQDIADSMTDVLSPVGSTGVWTQALWSVTAHTYVLISGSGFDTVPRSQRKRELGVGV